MANREERLAFTMKYNFDIIPSRYNTASIKWDHYPNTDILPMWVADMDFKTAPEVIAELKSQVDFGVMGYTYASSELNKITVRRLKDYYQWDINEEWLVWLPGLVPGLNMACRSAGKDGDKVLVLTPIYPPFLKAPNFARRQKVTQNLQLIDNEWKVNFNQFEKTIEEENIKILLFCNPHNPLGKVYNREELQKINEVCIRHKVIICSDEIHCDLILNPQKEHTCVASLSKEISEQSITLMSPSKTFNLPGLCCSFAIIPNAELRQNFIKSGEGFVPHPGILGYAGCLAAFKHGHAWHQELLDYLRLNLSDINNRMKQLPKIKMISPDATYLIWIDTRDLNLTNPGKYFESKGLGLSDGRIFKGDGFVRLNFGTSRALLEKGLDRFEMAVKSC